MDQFTKELHKAHASFEKSVNDIVARARSDMRKFESAAAGLVGKAKARVRGTVGEADESGEEPAKRRKGKRVRRNTDQLRELAEGVVEMIRGSGKEGALALDIKKKFDGITGSVRQFVEKHTAHKIKQDGSKRDTRYRVA